ncbi:hypothetical protein RHCRD62_30614 [Rhodococcus sp. RD6.2]|nr:hypothetical protein RHCRD62_30614 [Rhodococcus sp. RD6.2]
MSVTVSVTTMHRIVLRELTQPGKCDTAANRRRCSFIPLRSKGAHRGRIDVAWKLPSRLD